MICSNSFRWLFTVLSLYAYISCLFGLSLQTVFAINDFINYSLTTLHLCNPNCNKTKGFHIEYKNCSEGLLITQVSTQYVYPTCFVRKDHEREDLGKAIVLTIRMWELDFELLVLGYPPSRCCSSFFVKSKRLCSQVLLNYQYSFSLSSETETEPLLCPQKLLDKSEYHLKNHGVL